MSQDFQATMDRRQRTHRTLIYVILATLPCYFCGVVVLFGFGGRSERAGTPTATVEVLTPTLTETPTETPTRTPTVTPGGPTLTLPATPTQFV
ncbi:MAG: hypothetical protein P8Z40_08975, partial [Chloroflexota bacterium]